MVSYLFTDVFTDLLTYLLTDLLADSLTDLLTYLFTGLLIHFCRTALKAVGSAFFGKGDWGISAQLTALGPLGAWPISCGLEKGMADCSSQPRL